MTAPVAYPPDVLQILSPTDLQALRSAFSEERMVEIAEGMLSRQCPPLAPWASFVMERFFRPDSARMAPGQREQLIVAMLTASHRGEGAFVAVHLYWALMYVDAAQLVDTLVLCGTYSGFDATHGGVATLGRVLTQLREACAAGEAPEVDAVLPRLLHAAG